jgi:uroporphyrin-III C-methyltransferase
MDISVNLAGRRVLVVGGARRARHTIARCVASGARVYLADLADAADGQPLDNVVRVVLPANRLEWKTLVSSVDLVISVGADSITTDSLERASGEARVWLTTEPPSPTLAIGRVTLVGGGPGDGQLLTVAAMAALREADVVFFDRLGPVARLAEWAPGAELVNVGKTPGHHAVNQTRIQELLVEAALAGKTVVRLKGGDPFVFGRGGEEVIACSRAGVPVTVVSGVTSAIAVPGAAGIPVTHREVSRLFTVVSGHVPLSETELLHLAGLGGTIVVLMGVGTLPHLTAGLARAGMAASMPVAVVEKGFSTGQRTTRASLDEIAALASRLGVRSPAVVVIGEVVRLSEQLDVTAATFLQDAAAELTTD